MHKPDQMSISQFIWKSLDGLKSSFWICSKKVWYQHFCSGDDLKKYLSVNVLDQASSSFYLAKPAATLTTTYCSRILQFTKVKNAWLVCDEWAAKKSFQGDGIQTPDILSGMKNQSLSRQNIFTYVCTKPDEKWLFLK